MSAQLQNGGFEDLNTLNMPSHWTSGLEFITIGDSIAVEAKRKHSLRNDGDEECLSYWAHCKGNN